MEAQGDMQLIFVTVGSTETERVPVKTELELDVRDRTGETVEVRLLESEAVGARGVAE